MGHSSSRNLTRNRKADSEPDSEPEPEEEYDSKRKPQRVSSPIPLPLPSPRSALPTIPRFDAYGEIEALSTVAAARSQGPRNLGVLGVSQEVSAEQGEKRGPVRKKEIEKEIEIESQRVPAQITTPRRRVSSASSASRPRSNCLSVTTEIIDEQINRSFPFPVSAIQRKPLNISDLDTIAITTFLDSL